PGDELGHGAEVLLDVDIGAFEGSPFLLAQVVQGARTDELGRDSEGVERRCEGYGPRHGLPPHVPAVTEEPDVEFPRSAPGYKVGHAVDERSELLYPRLIGGDELVHRCPEQLLVLL